MPDLISNQGPAGVATYLPSLSIAGVPTMGMSGIPLTTGRVIFTDAVNGNDGNIGSADNPVQTLAAAYAMTTSGHNDVVVMVGSGSTAATQRIASTFLWANNATHLIGITAPTTQGQRCRISTATGATANVNPLMNITGDGCIFSNFSFFQGVGESGTDEQLLSITGGQRNYFSNVHFGGMGSAAGAADADSWDVKFISDASENTFDRCVFGLESAQRTGANTNILFTGANAGARNRFYGCEFIMTTISSSAPLFLKIATQNGLNGSSLVFRDCLFLNLTGLTGSTQPAVVCTVASNVNGCVVFDRCTTNAAKYAAATTQVIVSGFPIGNGFSSGTFATAADA